MISVSLAVPIAFWKMPFYACFGELALLNDLGVCESAARAKSHQIYTRRKRKKITLFRQFDCVNLFRFAFYNLQILMVVVVVI